MKRFFVFAVAAVMLWPAVGCKHHNLLCGHGCGRHEGCSTCGSESVAPAQLGSMPQAPGHVAYPYYTLKGPRDFLYTP